MVCQMSSHTKLPSVPAGRPSNDTRYSTTWGLAMASKHLTFWPGFTYIVLFLPVGTQLLTVAQVLHKVHFCS